MSGCPTGRSSGRAHSCSRADLAARDLRGRRVVELGCGVGLPSVVAALGGADVLATDWYAEALRFVARNADAAGAEVATLPVDWTAPPSGLLARPPADLVVGADVLYEERNGPALAALVPRILAPDGELVVADPRRPHAALLVDALVAAAAGRSRPRTCATARARTRADRSSACTACGHPRQIA